jgi:hypothetical protein
MGALAEHTAADDIDACLDVFDFRPLVVTRHVRLENEKGEGGGAEARAPPRGVGLKKRKCDATGYGEPLPSAKPIAARFSNPEAVATIATASVHRT